MGSTTQPCHPRNPKSPHAARRRPGCPQPAGAARALPPPTIAPAAPKASPLACPAISNWPLSPHRLGMTTPARRPPAPRSPSRTQSDLEQSIQVPQSGRKSPLCLKARATHGQPRHASSPTPLLLCGRSSSVKNPARLATRPGGKASAPWLAPSMNTAAPQSPQPRPYASRTDPVCLSPATTRRLCSSPVYDRSSPRSAASSTPGQNAGILLRSDTREVRY